MPANHTNLGEQGKASAKGPVPTSVGAVRASASGDAVPSERRGRKRNARRRGGEASGARAGAAGMAAFRDTEPLSVFAYLQLAAQARELSRHRAAAGGGGDAEAVHKMRVATRRVRSALRTFRAVLPESLYSDYYGELRWLAAALGKVRDLDVYRERYGEARSMLTAEDGAALGGHERQLDAQAKEAAAELAAALESRRCTVLLRDFSAALAEGPPASAPREPTTREGAAAYIAAAKKEVLKRGRRIHGGSSPKRMHALRIRDKRFRYLLEFFVPLYGTRLKAALRASIRLQDVLGAYQDATTATARLREYASAVPLDDEFRAELLALGELIALEQVAGSKARKRFAKEWPRFEAAVAELAPSG